MDSLLDTPLPTFADFHLHPTLLEAVADLDYQHATLVQAQVIPLALENKDLRVSAETGSGKTAAFLLPTLHQLLVKPLETPAIQGLILVPTRELAKQIASVCAHLIEFTPLELGLIIGSDTYKEQRNLLRRKPDILIATPGCLLKHFAHATNYFTQLRVLILDEADRVLEMGFGQDVLTIAKHCNPQRQTLLFSATLTDGVMRVAADILKDPEVPTIHHFRHHHHAHIQQQIILCDDKAHKQKLLLWLLYHENYKKALVFTNTKVQADFLHNELIREELRTNVLHGDLEQIERNRVMGLYRQGLVNVLIATDLAARGLDIDDVQLVINFDMARNANAYTHRIGRTGRAGENGLAISLINPSEWNIMSGIERYLNQPMERRTIKELIGRYQGPKKVKKSGKAVSTRKKVEELKPLAPKVKIRDRDRKNIGKRRVPKKLLATEETIAEE